MDTSWIFADYPNFRECAKLSKPAFVAKCHRLHREYEKRSGMRFSTIAPNHRCTAKCLDLKFSSPRFPAMTLCLASGKVHACNMGGKCPVTQKTETGDIVCLFTGEVVDVDNILATYDYMCQSNLEYGEHLHGGIEQAIEEDDDDGGGGTHSMYSADFPTEDSHPRKDVSALNLLTVDILMTSHVPHVLRNEHGAIIADTTEADKEAQNLRSIENAITEITHRGRLQTGNRISTAVSDILKRSQTVILSFYKQINKHPKATIGETYIKALVYTFLETLAIDGIPGFHYAALPELKCILPSQKRIGGSASESKFHIHSGTISKAERDLKDVIKQRISMKATGTCGV